MRCIVRFKTVGSEMLTCMWGHDTIFMRFQQNQICCHRLKILLRVPVNYWENNFFGVSNEKFLLTEFSHPSFSQFKSTYPNVSRVEQAGNKFVGKNNDVFIIFDGSRPLLKILLLNLWCSWRFDLFGAGFEHSF